MNKIYILILVLSSIIVTYELLTIKIGNDYFCEQSI